MTAVPDHASARTIHASYLRVLDQLTVLARIEATLLDHDRQPLPPALVQRKEALVQDYALLSAAVKRIAPVLLAAGVLDPEGLEARIRRLVGVMKENQRRLDARTLRTGLRVEAVMRALARRDVCNDNPTTVKVTTTDTLPHNSLQP